MATDINQVVTDLVTAFSGNLPALLIAESLSDFEDYEEETLSNPEKRQLGVCIAEYDEQEDYENLIIIITCQLPKINSLKKYMKVILNYLRTLSADTFGYHSLKSTLIPLYPGEVGGGGGGSFLFFELNFELQLRQT